MARIQKGIVVDVPVEVAKDFIEKRQVPTGAWRGEIHGGRVV